MSIYHTVEDHLNEYIESLGGKRSTLEDAVMWVARALYHHDEAVRLLAGLAMHNSAMDREALTRDKP